MRQLQPVLWTKGTLLTPQHLQLQDRFIEDTLRFRLETTATAPWGFTRLLIDREALASGNFAVSQASGIFPDGLLFDIPEADAAPAPKALAEQFGPDDTSVDVWLAVPAWRERGLNVALPGNGGDTRYIAEVALVRDEVRGTSERPVQVARKGFRLLFGNENRQGYSTLRVARIDRSPAGTYHVNEALVPPLLDVAASEPLMTLTRRLIEILTSRSAELAGLRRERNQSLADFTSTDIANFWLLYTINTHYPLLRHVFEVRHGHPESLYSILLSLAGALTTFSTDTHPRDLPIYDHDNLGDCFPKLDAKIRLLLDAVIPKNYIALEMRQMQPSVYATALSEDRFFDNTRFYLAINADIDQGHLITRVPQLVKVGSASAVEQLMRYALPGLELRHVVRPPASLPVKRHHAYFSLDTSGSAWESVVKSRNIAAYVPADLPGAELELLILFARPQ